MRGILLFLFCLIGLTPGLVNLGEARLVWNTHRLVRFSQMEATCAHLGELAAYLAKRRDEGVDGLWLIKLMNQATKPDSFSRKTSEALVRDIYLYQTPTKQAEAFYRDMCKRRVWASLSKE